MIESFIHQFEEKVLQGITACGISEDSLFCPAARYALGVSGGADSTALLVAFVRLRNRCSHPLTPLYVVTVNHNIRPEKESFGDAEFVANLCAAFPAVFCTVSSVPQGHILSVAAERKKGIEDAARFVRYEIFNNFCQEYKIESFFLAHTQNDHLETVLLRFLQGSDCSGLAGIMRTRGKFCRPLLSITRAEIERYLKELHISYRVDKTNMDPSYLRNRIRLQLVPLLDTAFNGWRSALLSGSEKAFDDSNTLEAQLSELRWITDDQKNTCCMQRSVFFSVSPAIRRRLLYTAFSLLHISERIPYHLVRNCITGNLPVSGKGIEIILNQNNLCIRKYAPPRKKIQFFVILNKKGIYSGPYGTFYVCNEQCLPDDSNGKQLGGIYTLPVCIRTMVPGDKQRSAVISSADTDLNLVIFSLVSNSDNKNFCRIYYTERSL